jgi:non-canonical purine NTP pyrophosphatase (RdgB/HAM1 family)
VRLLVATTNLGKIREFRDLLGAERFDFDDLSAHREIPPVEETGRTFRANACLKASYYARHLSAWTLADDSGLAVDALDGKPGVHSARWAEMHGAGKGDAANNQLLLRQMEGIADERRTARFVCVLALADPIGQIILTTMDSVEGRLLRSPRGGNGFGYDPLFYMEELSHTTAELAAAEKHAVSHRGKALRRMRELMVEPFTSQSHALGLAGIIPHSGH